MIPYHSGVPVEAWTEPVVREAAEGAEPEQLLAPGLGAASTARHNARLYAARREFEDARSQPEIRAAAPSGALAEAAVTLAVGASFWVHFWTPRWRPTHRVTIRCAEAGWTADIHGLYRFGGWHFEFGIAAFPAGITMKFVLDGTAWMDGFDHQLGADSNHHFVDAEVRFPDVPARVAIPFHNFTLDPDKDEQDLVGANRNSQIVYDVIVVGSGMGGGILADQLSDRGVRTLVLEAGGLTLPSHINNLPGDWGAMPGRYQVLNFENRDDSQFLFGVQMGLGGRSVFWSGLIPRMRPWEMTAWPSAVRTWLLADGYAHAERLMRKRETLGPFQDRLVTELAVALPEYEVSDQPRSQHQPNLGPGGVIGDVLESPTGTFSTADLLLDSLGHGNRAGRDNLTVNLHHLVRRVESNGPELATAVCDDLAGNVERRYRARFIVLCAGSIERTRIALRSGLPDPNHRIGRGLTDHPAFFSHPGSDYGYPIPATLPNGDPHPYGDPSRPAKILLRHRSASSTQHAFNTELLLNGWYWDLRHSDDDLRNEILASQSQARVKFTFILESPLDDGNWLALQGDDRPIALRVAPNRPDRPFHDACKQLRNRLLDFFRITNPDPGQDIAYGNQGTPHHAGGSLRMSADGTGVVDADLRFERVPNLYACDCSVFPSIPSANPSLTLAALSLRLADHLVGRVGR